MARQETPLHWYSPGTLCRLGHHLAVCGDLDAAIACFDHSVATNPSPPSVPCNLGRHLAYRGDLDAAIADFPRSSASRADLAGFHSRLLMSQLYRPGLTGEYILSEHTKFDIHHGLPILDRRPHDNSRQPGRRLKVGYVSNDFRDHAASRFFEPLLKSHDPEIVSTYCYSDTRFPDDVTARLRGMAAVWRDTRDLMCEAMAELIRADGIDILVDLGGHTAGGPRMPLFARKPAPIQVTWLGYPATTGLSAMDYRIVDSITDPEGDADGASSESLVRLGRGFLTFQPPPPPEIATSPGKDNGFLTFGSFNTIRKCTAGVIGLWSALLRRVPDARLLLKSKYLASPIIRRLIAEQFTRNGVAQDRLDLLAWTPDSSSHLDCYARIDVALDPFPYNGTTTTCEALSQGVPVVTLAGERHSARVGASLLTQIGLPDLVATSEADYLAIATALAEDHERCGRLREEIPNRLRASTLCDGAGFARLMEAAYRVMWRRWCQGQGGAPFAL